MRISTSDIYFENRAPEQNATEKRHFSSPAYNFFLFCHCAQVKFLMVEIWKENRSLCRRKAMVGKQSQLWICCIQKALNHLGWSVCFVDDHSTDAADAIHFVWSRKYVQSCNGEEVNSAQTWKREEQHLHHIRNSWPSGKFAQTESLNALYCGQKDNSNEFLESSWNAELHVNYKQHKKFTCTANWRAFFWECCISFCLSVFLPSAPMDAYWEVLKGFVFD